MRARIHRVVKDLKKEMKRIGRMSKSDLKSFAKSAAKEINSLVKDCKSLAHKEYFRKQMKRMDKLKTDLNYVIKDYRSKSRKRSSMRMHNGGKQFYHPQHHSARHNRTSHRSASQTSFTESLSAIRDNSHSRTKPITR